MKLALETGKARPGASRLTEAVRGAGFKPRFLWVEVRRSTAETGVPTASVLRLDTTSAQPAWEEEGRGIEAALEAQSLPR